jgi:hypothetical protein
MGLRTRTRISICISASSRVRGTKCGTGGSARSNESRRFSRHSKSWVCSASAVLMAGPVKLDVFFEREGDLVSRQRIAVKRLWGTPEIYQRFKIGDDLGDAAIKHALESNVLGILQGATWPVRILARGQIDTFLFGEILLIETVIVPLMLLETDRRAFHRNMFTRAKLIAPEQREECARLIDRIVTSVRSGDRIAMRDLHIEMHQKLCLLAGAAFEKYGLKFPPQFESEMVEFYQREWPM